MKSRLGVAIVSITGLLLACLALGGGPAAADQPIVACTAEARATTSATGPEYVFRRCGVPDFDQLRSGLGSDGGLPEEGAMYCGPTATANWLLYVADHGAPSVQPGAGFTEDYLTVSNVIHDLGDLMGTDPLKGTGSGGVVAGTTAWLDQSYGGHGGDYFVVREDHGRIERVNGVLQWVRPSGRDLAQQAVAGNLVTASIGWYEAAPIGADYGFLRDGGHFVTLASARPYGSTGYLLGFNDPGSDEGAVTHGRRRQSNWMTDLVDARPSVLSVGPDPDDAGGEKTLQFFDRLHGYGNGYLEGMVVIEPKFALLPEPGAERLTLQRAVSLDEGPPRRATSTLDGRVIDIALDPRGIAHAELRDDGSIRFVNDVDGTTSDGPTIPNASDIVIDDQLRTTIIDSDGRITSLDVHGNPAWELVVPGATRLAFSPHARALITFDAANAQLLVLTDDGDGGEPTVRRLPAIPGNPVSPAASLSVNPVNGVVGLLEPGTNRLTRIAVSEHRFVTTDELSLGDGAPLEGLVADATGAWYSTRGGLLVAFDEHGVEMPGNPFAGQPTAPMFAISQPIDIGEAPEGPNVLPDDAPRDGDRLVLTQVRGDEEVGAVHEVTLALTDDAGAPFADREVAYRIDGAHPATGSLRTDAGGLATISWAGSTVGIDELVAWHEIDVDGVRGAEEVMDGLAVTWSPRTVQPTTSALTSSANPSRAGKDVTFTATVGATDPAAGAPTGTVRFTDGGRELAVVDLDGAGQARLTTRTLTVGTHAIEATYVPAAGSPFTGSSATLSQTVRCSPFDLVCILSALLGLRPPG